MPCSQHVTQLAHTLLTLLIAQRPFVIQEQAEAYSAMPSGRQTVWAEEALLD